ncbi:protein FAR1-RELATED SEQUENCE 6 [Cajanus cajan]|uniref:Protein FAR1-RELATED SEQUENCE n=1 Tax=Cajanus cajan TaxID=3821 RepID=A0A151S6I2_CAJCA|nr:protein FAR1-RELATED SEQUENCE 6 [Cajanus cajan]KYP50425.1 Protein FAR1-RELATED SEQUENCE 6 [Cajanus cajan]
MDKVCLNSEAVADEEGESNPNPVAPAVGMEFETYEDVYYFYNCYAKEQGFGVRVTNTWYRKTKERYRAKLSCSSAGFKKSTEANRPRPQTRTGCPAMIKFRLMDSTRWRIIEVELHHNHLINPTSGKFYKSHNHIALGTKRTLHLDAAAAAASQQVHKIRMFRTVIIDASLDVDEGKSQISLYSNQLKLKKGDAEAILNFFSHQQLADPDFFYVVDVNERGCLRNLFWADAKSRVAYSYFNDVVAINTVCLTGEYQVPLVLFLGMNHHKQSILFGCGLLAGDTVESYTWLFRAWLTCILGRPPQVIITDQCGILQTVVADVFPRSTHCLCLFNIMQKVPEKLGACVEYEAINAALNRAVYFSLRAEDFEANWEDTMKSNQIRGNKWLQSLYEDRKRWAPVYLKEIFLAGMLPIQPSDVVSFFFDGYLNEQTSLKEFVEKYDHALQTKRQLEALADLDSKSSSFVPKSRSYFELQVSKLYTNEILRMFEREVEGMFSCFNSRQINVDGPVITYIVQEQVEVDGNQRDATDYEVCYNEAEMEVLCICGLFNFRGYLCRHALFVLGQNGIKEIPAQYILSRWRKDMKRSNVYDHNCCGIDISNPVHRYDHLYRQIVKVAEEGKKSHDHYRTAVQALENILSKLHLVNVGDPNIMYNY